MALIERILIANRGEIACRVIRTARAMGIHTIAVYSEADHDAPHRTLADEAVCIGPGPVGESYLDGAKLLAVAQDTHAHAVHPGYGFLSENADFASACAEAGIIFIGPSPEAINSMGNKAASKRIMIDAGVPCIPGYEGEDQDREVLVAEGNKIGFPLMVKASAGGGGRGMRLVHQAADLLNGIELASSEALSAFGNGELILEKAVIEPRHVEVQVMADNHGNVVHLGERDCSVQRRHQKVLEESPCPVMTPELRRRMGEAAVAAARRIDYRGAGTVEFLLDADFNFFFLEMNTRLQVEHPVTELVTGLDLVSLQIQVARDEVLTIKQSDIDLKGHAIEARVYAENPANDFSPATGLITRWQPAEGPGIRIDDGVVTGQLVSPFYDSMLAKVIGYGQTRDEALKNLSTALRDTVLFGPESNMEFVLTCANAPEFAAGRATTAFIADTFGEEGYTGRAVSDELVAMAVALRYLDDQRRAQSQSLGVCPATLGWSSNRGLTATYKLMESQSDVELNATVASRDPRHLTVSVGESTFAVVCDHYDATSAQLRVGSERFHTRYQVLGDRTLYVTFDGVTLKFSDLLASFGTETAAGEGTVLCPMHGVVVDMFVKSGDRVEQGDRLAVLEAMKMQHEIKAPTSGKIIGVAARKGQQIAAEELLIEIEPDAEE
ncbi:MAG: acetyl-CoA carboxylase biotin carboxylase subunit [Gammaproteobacteria bacterium]